MSRFLLVFDLDGTLVDTAPDLHAALNQMLRERGRSALSLPQVKRMIGDGVPALVARALVASGADPADAAGALPRFLELYEPNATRLSRPYPKVLETLTSLRQRGYRTSICTNKPQRATIAVVCSCRSTYGSPAGAGSPASPAPSGKIGRASCRERV